MVLSLEISPRKVGLGTNFPWNFGPPNHFFAENWSPSEKFGHPAKVFGWNHAYIDPPAKDLVGTMAYFGPPPTMFPLLLQINFKF